MTATRPKQIKRFYEEVSIQEVGGLFRVLLDGKALAAQRPSLRPMLSPVGREDAKRYYPGFAWGRRCTPCGSRMEGTR